MLRPLKKLLVRCGYHSKPDFLIVGAQKGGTTALYDILNRHSRIRGTSPKEIHYFSDDRWYHPDTLDEYAVHFPLPVQVASGQKLFESTPCYLCHPDVPRRLHAYHPELKLIILLREPVERAFSAWTMFHHQFRMGGWKSLHDPRDFAQVVAEDLPATVAGRDYPEDKYSYFGRGLYRRQIEACLRYFSRDQLYLVESAALRDDFERTIGEIQDFIGVSREPLVRILSHERVRDEREIYQAELAHLREFYAPHNVSLFNLLGRKLPSFRKT